MFGLTPLADVKLANSSSESEVSDAENDKSSMIPLVLSVNSSRTPPRAHHQRGRSCHKLRKGRVTGGMQGDLRFHSTPRLTSAATEARYANYSSLQSYASWITAANLIVRWDVFLDNFVFGNTLTPFFIPIDLLNYNVHNSYVCCECKRSNDRILKRIEDHRDIP